MFSYFAARSEWNKTWYIRKYMTNDDILSRLIKNEINTATKDEIVSTADYISVSDIGEPSELIISVSAGRNLPAMDINGKSDCYIIVTIGNKSLKSKVITSLNPIWNEVFKFEIDDMIHCNYIMIDIFDQDTITKDDDIGTIMIHLSDCDKYSDEYEWIPLQRKSNILSAKDICGEIKLKLELKNIIFNHNEIYKDEYEKIVLPLTRSLSLNAMLLKSSDCTHSHNNSRVLKKYIGFNIIPTVTDESKDESSTSDEEERDFKIDQVPCFMSLNSTHLYRASSDFNESKEHYIEYPANCEKIELYMKNVMLLFNKFERNIIYGDLYLTNFRILLKINKNEDLSQQILFGCILEIKSIKTQIEILADIICNVLCIKVKDGRMMRMVIPSNCKNEDKDNILISELYNKLNVILNNIDNDINNLNAIHLIYNDQNINDDDNNFLMDKWNIFDIDKEFSRQKLDDSVCKSFDNKDYLLCNTYPSIIYIPSSLINDNDIKEIKNAASYRSKCRLPVLIWYNADNNNSLLRCSQPSGNDINYIKEIRKSLIKSDDTYNVKVIFFDCRSKIAAQANQLKGKGTENIDKYDENTCISFLEIGNIHCMRNSYDALIDIVSDRYLYNEYNENEWLKDIAETKWNEYIKLLIKSSSNIARKLLNAVNTVCIIHCSDGWDRTSQISALTQLLIDPYYRRINGFIILIEKEWLSFGHKFNERNGFVLNKKDERSPIFLQFLECVWQIMQIFTSEFEFTEDLIVRLCDHHNSNWFGNFLYNSEKQRVENEINKKTISLWSWPIIKNKKYNPKLKLLNMYKCINTLQPIFDAYFFQKYDNLYSELANIANINIIETDIDENEKPKWISKGGINACQRCTAKFNIFYRWKHHCRSCGRICCHQCSEMEIQLKQFGYMNPVRVCDSCFKLNKL